MREVALPSQVVWSSRLPGFGEERVDEQDLVDEGYELLTSISKKV